MSNFAMHKILLLKKKYAHEVRKYILAWTPWNEKEPPRGYQKYVYYIAEQWVRKHAYAKHANQVKLEDIQEVINVKDLHADALGQNEKVLSDLSGEIPTDSEWVRYAYAIQNQTVNIWEPEQGPGYSGTFHDLVSFFTYILSIAREMNGRSGRETETVAAKVQPVVKRQPTPHHPVFTTCATYTDDFDGEPESSGEDNCGECEHDEEVAGVNALSAMQQQQQAHLRHGIGRILEITGVKQVATDQIMSAQEWSNRKPYGNKEQKFPSSFAQMAYGLRAGFDHNILTLRLLRFVNEAVKKLYRHINKEPMEILEHELSGCNRYFKPHFVKGSHTAIVCIQRLDGSRTAVVGIQKLIQKYVSMLAPESASRRCQAAAQEKDPDSSCRQGKCSDQGYMTCPEQRKYYYQELLGGLIMDEFEVLERYTIGEASRNELPDQLNPQEVKQLVLSIVIQAFTLRWSSN